MWIGNIDTDTYYNTYCLGIDLGRVYVRMCGSSVLTIRKWREHMLQPSFSRLLNFGAVTRIPIYPIGTLYLSESQSGMRYYSSVRY